jgi:hypothetical protein
MKKRADNQMKKKILVKALRKNLDKMSKSPWVGSFKDGKDLICPFCEQPVQPCKSDPGAMCEHMLLDGTEGKVLEDALKNPGKGQYGLCISCGNRISTMHLKKHPTAELCSQCIQKWQKLTHGKSAHA